MRFFAPQGRHVAPMGVKFGMAWRTFGPLVHAMRMRMEEGTFGPLLHAKFHPHRCNVSPLRGEKPQNRPLSKLNTGRFALRAMLTVIKPIIFTPILTENGSKFHSDYPGGSINSTSDQSNLTTGHITATHRWYNGIRQVAPVCSSPNTCFFGPT